MKFKVFIRTLFLVVVLSVVAYTVYANIANPGGTAQRQPENGTAATGTVVSGSGGEEASGSGTGGNEETGKNYIKENVTLNISALGDVALGQDSRFNYTDSFDDVFEKVKGDYGYFFSNVKDILSKDDLTMANLETALSNETEKAEKYDYGNNYWFNGKPEYANILKAGSIEAVNLANNHTYDYGQKGYDATSKALDDAGIGYFGYDRVLHKELKGVKIGMAGFNQLGNVEQGLDMAEFKKEVAGTVKQLREESDFVIVNIHWGKEYEYAPEESQKELAHLLVDSGADLVIGHHPHVLQPVEKYKGRYIVYSLGNFCFGGNKTPEDYDTAIYQQSFTFDSDNVLQTVAEPTIVPCSISSQKSFNNYKPTLAAEPQISSVYGKLKLPKPEKDTAELENSDMVRVDQYVDNILVDLRYAGSNNVIGRPVYESDLCYLRKGTADKLAKANEVLQKKGYKIKVWDGYRAQKYQQFLHDNAPNKSVFMDPKIGSNHTRGSAVDCTLVTLDGGKVDMPSDFDDGTALAYRTYEKCTEKQKKNALILQNAMESSGFKPYQKEWWHFDDSEYKSYPLLEDYKG